MLLQDDISCEICDDLEGPNASVDLLTSLKEISANELLQPSHDEQLDSRDSSFHTEIENYKNNDTFPLPSFILPSNAGDGNFSGYKEENDAEFSHLFYSSESQQNNQLPEMSLDQPESQGHSSASSISVLAENTQMQATHVEEQSASDESHGKFTSRVVELMDIGTSEQLEMVSIRMSSDAPYRGTTDSFHLTETSTSQMPSCISSEEQLEIVGPEIPSGAHFEEEFAIVTAETPSSVAATVEDVFIDFGEDEADKALSGESNEFAVVFDGAKQDQPIHFNELFPLNTGLDTSTTSVTGSDQVVPAVGQQWESFGSDHNETELDHKADKQVLKVNFILSLLCYTDSFIQQISHRKCRFWPWPWQIQATKSFILSVSINR